MTGTANRRRSGDLKGAASLHRKELVLTVVNPNVSKASEAEIGGSRGEREVWQRDDANAFGYSRA